MATDLEFAKSEIRYPFVRFALHSAENPPSGINAANGYWVQTTLADGEVSPKTQLGSPTPTTPILNIFWGFLGGVQQAFSYPNVDANLTTHPNLALPALASYGSDIVSVLIDVWAIWKGGDRNSSELKKQKDELFADIKKVYDEVQADGNLTQGTHANGHIAKSVADAANAALAQLNAQFPKGTNTDVGHLADALRVVLTKLATLPTDGYDPWLTAVWQISFQGIASAAARAFA